jgi:uncharacterized protein
VIAGRVLSSDYVGDRLTVIWHAGEPFVVPVEFYREAVQIINKENKTSCKISHAIQTNGLLVTQEWCDFIRESGIRVGLSIDGPQFIHDKHRKTRSGKGTFEQVMKSIELLHANEIDFHAIAVLTNESLDCPDEIYQFFKENNVPYVGFNVEEVDGANTHSSVMDLNNENRYIEFMRRMLNLSKDNAVTIREFHTLREFIYREEDVSRGQQINPFSVITIDCKGNYTTFSPELLSMKSELYGDFILGNLVRDPIYGIAENSKLQKINDDIQEGIEYCKNTCDYFSLCGGGVPSNKYFENGTFASSETMFCRFSRKIIIDLVLDDLENTFAIS